MMAVVLSARGKKGAKVGGLSPQDHHLHKQCHHLSPVKTYLYCNL